jgi:hypothetical protein
VKSKVIKILAKQQIKKDITNINTNFEPGTSIFNNSLNIDNSVLILPKMLTPNANLIKTDN